MLFRSDIYAQHTKQSKDQLKADMERDLFMTAEQAVAYGLADSVLVKRA